MSVLVDKDIAILVNEHNLIVHFENASLEGASYDMRLGHQCVKNGEITTLTENRPSLRILPGEFAMLRSLEELNMPLDLIGHNGIMSPWAKRGLVSLFSPQIDPGFCGFLIVPVFNAGDQQIILTFREKIFTVEFVKCNQPASYGWSQRYNRQDKFPVPVTPSHVRPNLIDIQIMQNNFAMLTNRLDLVADQNNKIDTRLQVMEARFDVARDAQNLRIGKWTIIIAALGAVVAIVASDWLRVIVWDFAKKIWLKI